MFRWRRRGGGGTVLAVRLLMLLLHQGEDQGFELLDTIANTSNGGLPLRIWCICARGSDVLA